MKSVFFVAALLAMASARFDSPFLCDECDCREGMPYTVDCMTRGFTEVPLTSPETDEYPFSWVLHLRGSRIANVPVLAKREQLIKISFLETDVSTIADSAFAELTNLQSLDLAKTKLTEDSFTVDAFKGPADSKDRKAPLRSLEILDISHNAIERLPTYAFEHLGKLKVLRFTDTLLHDLDRDTITAFASLDALESLDLSRNSLTRIPSQFLAEFRNLEELNLSGNLMETVPEELSHSKTLQYINLDHNPIMTISPTEDSSFRGPASLESLSISHMPYLKVVAKEAFVGLENLRSLQMVNNPRLEYIDKRAFLFRDADRQRLSEVYLRGNALRTLHETLLPWTSISKVDIQHNPWACDCHIAWWAEGFYSNIVDFTPQLAKSIVCESPPAKLGVSVGTLIDEDDEFPCPKDLVPEDGSKLYGSLVLVTIFLGIITMVTATGIFSFLLYIRAKERHYTERRVQYIKARMDNDLEAIPEVDEKQEDI